VITKKILLILVLGTAVTLSSLAVWQEFGGRRRGRRGGFGFRTPRLVTEPMWQANEEFSKDVFTFARVQYTSNGQMYGQPQWSIDYPDSDLNLSLRLKELTSLEVNPLPAIVRFDQPEVFDYPFLYLIEPGFMSLTIAEIEGFRKYIDRGGFVMVDDFWADDDSWKDSVMRPDPEDPAAADNRTVRHDTPQYQSDEDRIAADAQDDCPTCVFL